MGHIGFGLPRLLVTLTALLMAALLNAPPATAQFGTFAAGDDFRYPADIAARMAPNVGYPGEIVTIEVTVAIDEGWYIYAMDPVGRGPIGTSLTLTESEVVVPAEGAEWTEPTPQRKFDQGFQTEIQYYDGTAVFSHRLEVQDVPNGSYDIKGNIRIQICDDSVCLPPRRHPFEATLLVRGGTAVVEPAEQPEAEDEVEAAEQATEDETDESVAVLVDPELQAPPAPAVTTDSDGARRWASEEDRLAGDGMIGLIIKAFAAGLISLLTPCVFPMIPITISFFTKRAAKSTRERIGLCTVYSGSIVLGFALLGFGLALALKFFGFGAERAGSITVLATNPWFNLFLAAVFVTFAMSLLGLFEIGLPTSWANKLQQKKGGRSDWLGAVMMAGIFVIISFTCTAPIVGPLIVLTFGGFWLQPFIGLTAYAVGFALPFFLLGLLPGALNALPKSGDWLNATKVTMGLLELGLAMKFLSNTDLVWNWNILTREVLLASWVAIGIVTMFYLLGTFRMMQERESPAIGPFRMMFAVLFGTIGFYLAYGLLAGQMHPFIESYMPPDRRPYAAAAGSPGGAAASPKSAFIRNDFEGAQARSRETGKPLFVDFTGWTCTNCRLNELNVFPQPRVQELFDDYILVALYTDDHEFGDKNGALQLERFRTMALPYYVILTPDDEQVATFGGLIRNPGEFIAFLEYGIEETQRRSGDRLTALVP